MSMPQPTCPHLSEIKDVTPSTQGCAECLARGEHGLLVGWLQGKPAATPLTEVVGCKKALDLNLLELARMLAR